jgi:hypothetical protein
MTLLGMFTNRYPHGFFFKEFVMEHLWLYAVLVGGLGLIARYTFIQSMNQLYSHVLPPSRDTP